MRFCGVIKPKKLPEVFSHALVYIQPSESENFGHSLAEALSAGLPVITSHNTPWQELTAHKAGINAERNTADLAGAINFFTALGTEEYAAWQQGAANYLRQKINSAGIISGYENFFNRHD